ncbi:MAG: hypothetical protein ACLGGX_05600 [Bdellovibrionia bacterium]
MLQKLTKLEDSLSKQIDQLTANPLFLEAVSQLINFNSLRKIWLRQTLEAVWTELELPVRQDQQKLLQTVEELRLQVKLLELSLAEKTQKKNQKSNSKNSQSESVQISESSIRDLELQ